MKKLVLVPLLLLFSFQIAPLRAENDAVLFENLANDPWFDHVRAWNTLFSIEKIENFLELAEGKATKFFLNNCDHVTSVSLITISTADQIFPIYYDNLDLFDKVPNWTPQLHIFSDLVDKANKQAYNGVNPELVGEDYAEEISQFCEALTREAHYDAIFVDPRLVIRGDLVNALFNKADIIATHDTNFIPNIYGWNKLSPPDDYETIHFSYGSGTTFWIKKEKQELIQKLRFQAS